MPVQLTASTPRFHAALPRRASTPRFHAALPRRASTAFPDALPHG
jgi:hypothetical protein